MTSPLELKSDGDLESDRDLESDNWSRWLLHHRHADNPEYAKVVERDVQRFADRVLDEAQLSAGMSVIDVGAGTGLLAFRAIARIGPALRLFLTDISAPLLRHAEKEALRRDVRDQCSFHVCSAEKLTAISDSSMDAALTRASMAYVADKKAAFSELFRVLKPGGRICIAEPILQDEAFAARVLKRRVEAQGQGPADQFLALLHRWKSAQYPDTEASFAACPHVNFSERDLVNMASGAGFRDIHLRLHIDVVPALITSWEVLLGTSPHPLAPTLGQIMAERFSASERDFFERTVRPTVESGTNLMIERVAYMSACKPGG